MTFREPGRRPGERRTRARVIAANPACRVGGDGGSLVRAAQPLPVARPGLPLSKPRKSEGSRPRLRDRLQLCKAPQRVTMENALRGYLRRLDGRP
jgi:type IV secretory pathway protease TraF